MWRRLNRVCGQSLLSTSRLCKFYSTIRDSGDFPVHARCDLCTVGLCKTDPQYITWQCAELKRKQLEVRLQVFNPNPRQFKHWFFTASLFCSLAMMDLRKAFDCRPQIIAGDGLSLLYDGDLFSLVLCNVPGFGWRVRSSMFAMGLHYLNWRSWYWRIWYLLSS